MANESRGLHVTRITRLMHAATAAAILAAAACSGSRAATESAAALPTVAVVRVDRADLSRTLTLAAEFRPFQEVDIHAKVAGYVKSIFVDVGDRVKAGQELAILEIPEMRDEVQQNDAAVQRSAEDIKRAEAELQRAESAHQVAHLGSTRLAAVIKSRPNLVAQQDLDDAAARDRMAEAQVATAKAAQAVAQQQLAVSKASASRTRTLLDYSRITAPFDGVVTHRYADTGSMIQAGTSSQTQTMPVVKLSQNNRLRLVIDVPESAVSGIHIGEPVQVRVDAVGRSFPGAIARFARKVNPDTRTMETEVDVDNPDLTLVPGMYASTTITLDQARGVLAVPVLAVDRTEDKTSVLLVKDGRVDRRIIKVGLESPDRVEVASGLSEGDLVVIGSRAQLRPGAMVSPRLQAGGSEKP